MLFAKANTSKLIVGAKLNDPNNKEHQQMASSAHDKGLWFHSSLSYASGHLDIIKSLIYYIENDVNTKQTNSSF